MLKIERYGLLALFALCALILGVGVFGGDGSEAAWKPEMPPNSKAAGQLQETMAELFATDSTPAARVQTQIQGQESS